MLEKYPGERVVYYFNCTDMLGAGETITGSPSFVGYPNMTGGSAALVFESPSVNASPTTLPDGTVVAAGKLAQVTISGGQSSTDKTASTYSVVATFSTTAGHTLVSKSLLSVLPLGPTE